MGRINLKLSHVTKRVLCSSTGGNVKESYQEDLLKWVAGPEGTLQQRRESEEERRQWTRMQVELLFQEVRECTLLELDALCKKKGILIWSVKYYSPDFFRSVCEKTRTCALQEIIEEVEKEWCSPHRLRTLVKEKNAEHGLDRYHEALSLDDVRNWNPTWFDTVFEQRYINLTDIMERDGSSPRYRKVLDGEDTF